MGASSPPKVTNAEIEKEATDAMRFLRTCGSDSAARQADAIQRLIARLRKQDHALFRLAVTLEEAMENIETEDAGSERVSVGQFSKLPSKGK